MGCCVMEHEQARESVEYGYVAPAWVPTEEYTASPGPRCKQGVIGPLQDHAVGTLNAWPDVEVQ